MISTFTAFFDANVFYGARLRSLILHLAQTKIFRARWSEHIHDEWIRNLLANRPDLTAASLERTRHLMDEAVLDQEGIWVDGVQPIPLHAGGREVAEVEGDDAAGPADDRRRQDMPVSRVWQVDGCD